MKVLFKVLIAVAAVTAGSEARATGIFLGDGNFQLQVGTSPMQDAQTMHDAQRLRSEEKADRKKLKFKKFQSQIKLKAHRFRGDVTD